MPHRRGHDHHDAPSSWSAGPPGTRRPGPGATTGITRHASQTLTAEEPHPWNIAVVSRAVRGAAADARRHHENHRHPNRTLTAEEPHPQSPGTASHRGASGPWPGAPRAPPAPHPGAHSTRVGVSLTRRGTRRSIFGLSHTHGYGAAGNRLGAGAGGGGHGAGCRGESGCRGGSEVRRRVWGAGGGSGCGGGCPDSGGLDAGSPNPGPRTRQRITQSARVVPRWPGRSSGRLASGRLAYRLCCKVNQIGLGRGRA